MSRLASYCNTEFPLDTDLKVRSSSRRSKSPFRRRGCGRSERDGSVNMSGIDYQERRRPFAEDPELLETSAIEVVLESLPSTPRRKSGRGASLKRQPKPVQTPELTPVSSSSAENTPQEKREDMKRKSFKQKFMQKKNTNADASVTNQGLTSVTKQAPTCNKSTSTKTTTKSSTDDDRNPLETSRRCFPFSVHAAVAEKTRGRLASRESKAQEKTVKSANSQPEKSPNTTRIATPLRRRARSASRRAAAVAPTPNTASTSMTTSQPFRKTGSSNSKTPLIDPCIRASTEDEDDKAAEEKPDPAIEERLSMRPRLLSRLESHQPLPTPSSPKGSLAPNLITLARQKSIFSEVSTPSGIKSQHPVVQHIEESIIEATKNGKKIDRLLVYQTLLQIADSLESPEEQAAMRNELTLLIKSQEDPQPSSPARSVVPEDTFSPSLSASFGPPSTPPRSVGKGIPPNPKTPPSPERSRKKSSESVGSIPHPTKRTSSRPLKDESDDVSDDGFTEWAEDLESQSSDFTDVSTDTMHFLSEIFNFGSFFSGGRDVRDDEDEGEDEDDEEEVPEQWKNFKPPPGVSPPKPSRIARRRSSRLGNKNVKGPSDHEDDLSRRRGKDTSPERRAWWRRKNNEVDDDVLDNRQVGNQENPRATRVQGPPRIRERSLMKEEDNLSLSSIESLQYDSPRRRLIHPPQLREDESPEPSVDEGRQSTNYRRQRSKSWDGRRTMML